MRLDHLSYAAGSEGLGAAVQRLGSALGASFRDGGMHPRFGTRNFVLPLLNGVYLEVVEPLDHPATDKAPFGRAVKARSEAGGGWLAWVVAVDDISTVESRIGRSAVLGQRRAVSTSTYRRPPMLLAASPFVSRRAELADTPSRFGRTISSFVIRRRR